jgi:UDP-N-acetylmuramyl pentapeptide phosphotransferase/UDP-N-acetylglucosamine-1-phosphate transferase
LGWALLGWVTDEQLVCILGLLLATTSLGFLGHNWPPARIFMGDVGSAFWGYTFAILAVIAAQKDPRLALAWSQNIPGSMLLITLCMPLLCLMLVAFVTRQERLRSFIF